jgi:hypothetical protein
MINKQCEKYTKIRKISPKQHKKQLFYNFCSVKFFRVNTQTNSNQVETKSRLGRD